MRSVIGERRSWGVVGMGIGSGCMIGIWMGMRGIRGGRLPKLWRSMRRIRMRSICWIG